MEFIIGALLFTGNLAGAVFLLCLFTRQGYGLKRFTGLYYAITAMVLFLSDVVTGTVFTTDALVLRLFIIPVVILAGIGLANTERD